jgi:GTP-binding protein
MRFASPSSAARTSASRASSTRCSSRSGSSCRRSPARRATRSTRSSNATAAERADVALVLVDSSQGIVDQDLHVADVARKAGNSTLVVLSKWDISTITIEEVRGLLRRRLRQRPPFLAVSAKTGRGLDRLLDEVEKLFEKHTARIPTPELNTFLQELLKRRQPPSKSGRRLNLLYGTQIQTRPPRIRIFVNDPRLVTRDYAYWVENELRERFELDGVPVNIDFVRRT